MDDADGSGRGLRRADVDPDPLRQFTRWLEEARAAVPDHALDMVLATATTSGQPSVRWVLLRGFDERGFVFHTNYESRKARELDANARGALAWHWRELGRQVRVEGPVAALPREESERYFAGRPRGHRLAAWASPQGRVLADREELEDRYRAVETRFASGDVPLPPFWGGYRLTPASLEFWQSRDNRLHDRVHYVQEGNGWRIERLAP